MSVTKRKMKGYLITQGQLEQIEHFKRMFEQNSESIKELCSGEKEDIVYGFELGKMYSYQRQFFLEMMQLEEQIRSQPYEY